HVCPMRTPEPDNRSPLSEPVAGSRAYWPTPVGQLKRAVGPPSGWPYRPQVSKVRVLGRLERKIAALADHLLTLGREHERDELVGQRIVIVGREHEREILDDRIAAASHVVRARTLALVLEQREREVLDGREPLIEQ